MKKLAKTHDFTIVAVDVVIFTIKDGVLQSLLIELKKSPYEKHWALPGGMVMPDESVDQAVERHLRQKTGVKNVYLEQLYTFGEVGRDPYGRVVSVAYMALIPFDEKLTLKTTEAYSDIKWFPVGALPTLAYDHKDIVSFSLKRLRAKLAYTNIVFSLLPGVFTMGELQKVYEIILGKTLDKRNFQKKIKALKLVKLAGGQRRGLPRRPARLFSFASKKPQIVDIL